MASRCSSFLLPMAAAALLLLGACGKSGEGHVRLGEQPQPLRLELPASLERHRSSYERDVLTALSEAADCFLPLGLDADGPRLIDSVTVFEDRSIAREHVADVLGLAIENLPVSFSGTVAGRRLFLVSRESYQAIWQATYPAWPWAEENYYQLIVHELAHRAHEELALAGFGSAEAMGPIWFFEGLAVVCAGQFDVEQPNLSIEELIEQLGSGRTPKASYPVYGRVVRSLAAEYGMRELVIKASEPEFPDLLWSP